MTQTAEEQTTELAKLLAGNYIERRDVFARQFVSTQVNAASSGYTPVLSNPKDLTTRVPIKLSDIVDHVTGKSSYGHYLVSAANTCRMFAFDIDLVKKASITDKDLGTLAEYDPREVWHGPTSPLKVELAKQLKSMAHGLAIRATRLLGIKVTVHYSGNKGMHVIGLLDRGTPASDAREAAAMVLMSFDDVFEATRGDNFWRHKEAYNALEIEIFPKQDSVSEGGGLGNLVRLPLGVNLKSGKPSFFMDMSTPIGVFAKDDPLKVLTLGSIR